jgi:hypothetical protein
MAPLSIGFMFHRLWSMEWQKALCVNGPVLPQA